MLIKDDPWTGAVRLDITGSPADTISLSLTQFHIPRALSTWLIPQAVISGIECRDSWNECVVILRTRRLPVNIMKSIPLATWCHARTKRKGSGHQMHLICSRQPTPERQTSFIPIIFESHTRIKIFKYSQSVSAITFRSLNIISRDLHVCLYVNEKDNGWNAHGQFVVSPVSCKRSRQL